MYVCMSVCLYVCMLCNPLHGSQVNKYSFWTPPRRGKMSSRLREVQNFSTLRGPSKACQTGPTWRHLGPELRTKVDSRRDQKTIVEKMSGSFAKGAQLGVKLGSCWGSRIVQKGVQEGVLPSSLLPEAPWEAKMVILGPKLKSHLLPRGVELGSCWGSRRVRS